MQVTLKSVESVPFCAGARMRKPYKDGGVTLLFEREWNIEKIREIASGMLRKDRGIVRKKTTTPSGIVRKFAGVQRN
jgi:hypothetical protein